jgi:hypothetical protein
MSELITIITKWLKNNLVYSGLVLRLITIIKIIKWSRKKWNLKTQYL